MGYKRLRRYTLTFQHGLEDRRKLNINNHSTITHRAGWREDAHGKDHVQHQKQNQQIVSLVHFF